MIKRTSLRWDQIRRTSLRRDRCPLDSTTKRTSLRRDQIRRTSLRRDRCPLDSTHMIKRTSLRRDQDQAYEFTPRSMSTETAPTWPGYLEEEPIGGIVRSQYKLRLLLAGKNLQRSNRLKNCKLLAEKNQQRHHPQHKLSTGQNQHFFLSNELSTGQHQHFLFT